MVCKVKSDIKGQKISYEEGIKIYIKSMVDITTLTWNHHKIVPVNITIKVLKNSP